MPQEPDQKLRVFADRKRTNILRIPEQKTIHFLLGKIPRGVSPDMMTAIGTFGSIIVFISFVLAWQFSRNYLLLGIIGLAINWIGDSLDGRLAYYRNTPRKWYGFALDILMDWLSIILIGLGYYLYVDESAKVLGFLFVVFYGWAMLIALLRYKITDQYQIDSGLLGPTELRVLIALILISETIFAGSIAYLAIFASLVLFILNFADTLKLLKQGDERDKQERKP